MKIKKSLLKIKNLTSNKKEKDQVKTGFGLLETIVIVIVVVFLGIFIGVFMTYSHLSGDFNNKQLMINEDLNQLSNVYELILDKYYKEIDKDKIIKAAIAGMLSALDDPYSIYFNDAEKTSFNERMEGEYHGIGVELFDKIDGDIIIFNVFPNTPAEKAGLKAGDIIMKVDNKDTVKMTSADIAEYIKYNSGDIVKITVNRGGENLTFKVSKDKIILESIASDFFVKNNKKVGYINISLFANNTYDQFRDKLLELEEEKIDALIIDVRNNSGGYLDSIVNIVSMFLPKDTIIYQIESNKTITKYYDLTEEARTYPISILINKQSASAAEILAAVFKEMYESEVIGVKSYGKGTVQETKDLEDGGMIKFTTQKWLTPKGNSIDRVGIEPTIVVTIDNKYFDDPTPENDNQLQKAIEVLVK